MRFFSRSSTSDAVWQVLAKAIALVAATGDAELVQDNEYGRKYLVLGVLTGPEVTRPG